MYILLSELFKGVERINCPSRVINIFGLYGSCYEMVGVIRLVCGGVIPIFCGGALVFSTAFIVQMPPSRPLLQARDARNVFLGTNYTDGMNIFLCDSVPLRAFFRREVLRLR